MKANLFLLVITLSALNGIRKDDEVILILSIMLLPMGLIYADLARKRNED